MTDKELIDRFENISTDIAKLGAQMNGRFDHIETIIRRHSSKASDRTVGSYAISTEAPYEMANLFPDSTGLPFVVWVSYRANARHDVRVKVSPGVKAAMKSVALRPEPHMVKGEMDAADFRLLSRWMKRNRSVILKYWDGTIDTRQMIEQIKPL